MPSPGGVVLIVAGCGGGQKSVSGSGAAPNAAGAKVFAGARCGSCHTLQEAGTKGTVGPNLDQPRPSADRVARQVKNGGVGMPSFRGKLSDQQITDVADFVSVATRTAAGIPAEFKPDDTKIEDCGANGSANSCYEQAFANFAYDEGPKAALDEFQQLEAQNRTVLVNCHQIAHMIGAGGLLHFDGNVAKAFAEGNSTCGSGYYHGLLQWKLAGVKSSQVAGIAREVCNDPEIKAKRVQLLPVRPRPRSRPDALHGLRPAPGAGLLPQAPDRLRPDILHRRCLHGEPQLIVRSEDELAGQAEPALPLHQQARQRARQDLLLHHRRQRILPAVDYDWVKTADWCRRSEPGWSDECFQSYGRSVASVARSAGRATTSEAAARMRTLCHKAGSGEQNCIVGAVVDVLNNNPSDLTVSAVCDSVSRTFMASCYRTIGFMVGLQHSDTAGRQAGRQAACRQFAPKADDYAQCLSQAGA